MSTQTETSRPAAGVGPDRAGVTVTVANLIQVPGDRLGR
jgi:hypothetical protein